MSDTAATNGKSWILLVDDDANLREILGEALRDGGWPVITAEDAASGQAAMTQQPSLLITDIDLGPGPSGLALATHARTQFPTLPIILISGHWEPITPPIDTNFLRKPFRPATLLDLVKHVLPEA